MMRALIEQDGRFAVVAEAGDGNGGLEAVRRLRPDAVLLDISMPGMHGLAAIPAIKDCCSQTKVVMLSAAGRSLTAEAIEAGADGYFSKTEPLEHVVLALEQLFFRR